MPDRSKSSRLQASRHELGGVHQALNPYTYVQNNPLSYTDPSGYFLSGLFKAIGKVFSRVFKAIAHAIKTVLNSSIIRSLIQVAVCAATMATGPGICAATAGMMTMASGGSIVDAVKAFAFTLVSAGVWGGSDALGLGGGTFGSFSGGVGGMLSGVDPIAQLLVHGTVNGALTVAQGGDFLQGFATGAIGKAGGLLALESPLGVSDNVFQNAWGSIMVRLRFLFGQRSAAYLCQSQKLGWVPQQHLVPVPIRIH